jgi:outer membrane protein assembly factor BamB
MFISERRRRRRGPWVVALAALVLAGAALAAFLALSNRTDDVRRGDEVEFRAPPPKRPQRDDTIDWPVYHYDLAHTGYLPARVGPPFKERWVFSGNVLMEFPPIVVDGSVYFMRNNGGTYRLDADTGKVKWKNQIGKLSATSPAYWRETLFVSSLSGKITALRARNGKVLWQKQLGSRTESSPIVRRGVVYFGTEGGDLYALFAKTGRVKWKFSASGAIKASPALSGSTLYVGDYSGRMYAVWARTGRERWSTGTSGSKFGFAAGNFYSTPAVAFGRVYAGNTDGKVYSFGSRTGTLAWSHSTGGYVYSSPAVANVPGTRPTVYIGSYDGNMYALDARTGSTRWTARGGGRISGGPSIVGRIVYFADLDSKKTYGVDARNGKLVFKRSRGYYNPVVSDGKRLYMTGYASVTALDPVKRGGGSDR